ncbi:hypothetical protein B0J12DRAFT_704245 [Macrophomina phaseolina]|uniref:Uncharacterized protein n=1 Tax=Macrophomina phaseolina TaxID=35725 RepID=A0ABQ8FVR9_9PEZI|nr:hypothetical protein B0J12DRAFT_704245 [Macrophomina phaseolina]
MRTIRRIGCDTQTKSKSGEGVCLTNATVESMCNAFVDSGLVPNEDTYACIVPIFFYEKKLPLGENDLYQAEATAGNTELPDSGKAKAHTLVYASNLEKAELTNP